MITDNGSYRPESTMSLRSLAERLGAKVGHHIHAVSLLHSTKIDPEKIGGTPAEIFEPFIKKMRKEGYNKFHVTPMFFGPSAAIKEYLLQRVEALQEGGWPELEVLVAPCVVEPLDPQDTRMAEILVDHVYKTMKEEGYTQPSVALVDHGAPRKTVTDVRNHLATQMRELLPSDTFPHVGPCSMERRDGEEYAFNEPLLEHVVGQEGYRGEVIISMLFASPGRHAGPGGDVWEICDEAANEHEGLKWKMTDLCAKHDGLIDILAERFQQGMESKPVCWAEVKHLY